MLMLVHTAVWGPTPVAFVSVEALLLVAACLAAVGAVLTAWLVIRPGRRGRPGPSDDEDEVRRSPSPASLGLDEDPIVAALGIGKEKTRGPKP